MISLTPLIDVVFILLIFLMLVSNFLDRGAVEVSVGGTGEMPVEEADGKSLQLRLLADGRAELDGMAFHVSELGRELARAARTDRRIRVLVRISAGVDLQAVMSVISIADRISGVDAYLIKEGPAG